MPLILLWTNFSFLALVPKRAGIRKNCTRDDHSLTSTRANFFSKRVINGWN